jgi:tRNA nucleotidyltransferase (CCA-adding enzyme)
MAYNDDKGLIDPFDGQADINNKVISCVGRPNERFNEDALRMLRAVRFSAELDFSIAPDTLLAITRGSSLLEKISRERIREEFNKILLSNPNRLITLYSTGLLEYIVPEFKKCISFDQPNVYHVYDVGEHTIKAAENIEKKLVLRLTMLFHDIGKPESHTVDDNGTGHFYGHQKISARIARERMKSLKYDNETIDRVIELITIHDANIVPQKPSIKKWLNRVGSDVFFDFLKVKDADMSAQNPIFYAERREKLDEIEKITLEIIREQECFNLKQLAVNGDDLVRIGFEEGNEIGKTLDILLNMVIENPELNTKERLLSFAWKIRGE